MAKILKIYSYKDPILRTKCREVPHLEPWILALADDMWMTMLMSKAVGLAANQVGFDYCMITVKDPQFEGPMINPVIEERSEETFHYEEGCLSMPGYRVDIGKRSKAVKVRYTDLTGKVDHIWLINDAAVIVQHEIDHLSGIIFIDHLDKSLAE